MSNEVVAQVLKPPKYYFPPSSLP